ncbi:MAG TPA: cupin domain-containing protein [Nocardioides sp.]|nr:cupin domain-containing protein [Nocardioides sp.]
MDKLPVDPATAERLKVGPDEMKVLASTADTGGALFALEMRMAPGGGPPVMHRHASGEVYHVIEGEFTFHLGLGDDARQVTARAGDTVPMAGGTPHTIRNESDADAVAFVVHAPGAPLEDFSRAAALLAAEREPTIEDVLALAERHGIDMLGPIPAETTPPSTSPRDVSAIGT